MNEGYLIETTGRYFERTLDFCTALPEVVLGRAGRVDMVVALKLLLPEIWIVEAKVGKTIDARAAQQLTAYGKYGHRAYFVLSRTDISADTEDFCKREGWGILTLGGAEEEIVDEVVRPRFRASPRYSREVEEALKGAGWGRKFLNKLSPEYEERGGTLTRRA